MKIKKCEKCGTSERYKSGECKFCRNERKKAYRARVSGKDTEKNPIKKRKPSAAKAKSAETLHIDLSDSLSSGPKRLQFMIERHERTLRAIDEQEKRLAERLEEAEDAKRVTDIRFFTSERRKLLEMRVSYDARLAKDLQAYQELIAKEDNETPITFMQVDLPPKEWITGPAVGDILDLTDLDSEKVRKIISMLESTAGEKSDG